MNSRSQELKNIPDQQFDLCVIGGGATGSACALDAQLRGIRTVLLEAGDFAGATSSAATKIIHGGVRYLEEAIKGADLQEYRVLVRALHERVRMLENAPHLTRRLEFLVPSYHWIDVAYLDIGLKIYDWLAGPGRISPSKFLSREETLERMPELNPKGLVGSVAYADGQFDDARYNITLVQTFAVAGGNALNHAKVTDFLRGANGKISGVVVKDQLSEDTFSVKAKAIVNATGPVSDSIRQLATPTLERRMRPSKGSHILLPLEVFPTEDALLIPKTEDGRVLFAIPWGGRLLVGTTDEEVAPDAELVVTKADVEYMLRHINQYLAQPVTPDEIVSGFAGATATSGLGRRWRHEETGSRRCDRSGSCQRADQHHGWQVDYASRHGGRHDSLCAASRWACLRRNLRPATTFFTAARVSRMTIGKSCAASTRFLKEQRVIWQRNSALQPEGFLS